MTETSIAVIGANLRRIRLAAELSPERLAELAGVSIPTIYRVEAGYMAPKIPTLEKLCEVLGVGLADLLTGAST